jgi:hypothetical protein
MPDREKKERSKEKAIHKVTAAELTAVDKYAARQEAKPRVRFKVSKNGSDPQIEIDHPDKLVGQALVMEALASADCSDREPRNSIAETKARGFRTNVWWDPAGDPAALRLAFSRPVGFCSFASAPSATSAQLKALFQSGPRMV